MDDYRAWEDDEGTRAVIYEGRLSITGKPSMTADDGTVALGIDLPDDWRGAVDLLRQTLPHLTNATGAESVYYAIRRYLDDDGGR